MIVIVDYGLGNLGSVGNMFRKVGVRAVISADPGCIREASALILPGVGHFDEGMRNLHARKLAEPLTRRVREDATPLLGICLGVQLMARRSEEGSEPGLGWIDADVVKFRFTSGQRLAIPHMGWNRVACADDALVRGLDPADARFYFVHSFHLVCDQPENVVAWCEHGYRFAAAIHAKNLYGTQFHPEKSHRHGKAILANFAEACAVAR